jgi:hypothetical protein
LADKNAPGAALLDRVNAHNIRLFLHSRDAFDLSGVMSLQQVEARGGRYATGSLMLFPFKRHPSSPDLPAFLPALDDSGRLVETAPMATLGLPPDEFFCRYVIHASPAAFIGFELGEPIARGPDKYPWHTNLELGGAVVGARWASSNMNHPWFAGNRWIPADGDGAVWRRRIIDGVRRAAAAVG